MNGNKQIKKQSRQEFLRYYGTYRVKGSKIGKMGSSHKMIRRKIITPYLDQHGETIEIELLKNYKNGRLLGAFLWYAPYHVNMYLKRNGHRSFRESLYTMLDHIVSLESLTSETIELLSIEYK